MSSRFSRQSEAESVYNLIPQEPEKTKAKPMHRSKYPHDCPPTASTFGASLAAQSLVTNIAGSYESMPRAHREKSATGILGPKVEHYSDPTSFIKKGQQHPPLPQPTRFEYATTHKAALDTTLPATRVAAAATIRQSKNFINENALAVIMAEARRPVDTTLNYLEKADFGRTPAYLHKVQQEISAEKEYIRQVMQAEQEEQTKYQPKMKMLPEEEREKLLESLKKKWEAVNKQYQGMTHVVTLDTIGKIRRKEEYETELQHLEKSIDKLSKKYVFVHDG